MKNIILGLILFLFISCSGSEKEISVQGQTMGTYYRVKAYGAETPQELKETVDKFLKLFNNIFSTYIPDSEISKINASRFEHQKITDSFHKLLSLSLEISRKSYGYFDITVGPLVNAWGFGPRGKLHRPTEEQLSKLRKNIGFDKIYVKDRRLYMDPSMSLDMSAVAKGHGVDELIKFLDFRGYKNLMVEIGGEVRVRGNKFDGSLWRVGIEGPTSTPGDKVVLVVPLRNMSMATSGSYRNFLKYGDEVFNHTINPKTGKPTEHKTVSVSVLHEYCTDADAWATAFMSMGAKKGIDLANKNNIAAFFQVKEGDSVKTYQSLSFEKYLNKVKK